MQFVWLAVKSSHFFAELHRVRVMCDCSMPIKASTALIFGLSAPMLLGVVALGIDVSNFTLRKARLQELADTAAVSGARELKLAARDGSAAIEVAQSYVNANTLAVTDSGINFSGSVANDKSSITLNLSATIPTYIARTIGVLNTTVGAKATARLTGGAPICMLGLDQSGSTTIYLDQYARVIASGCAVVSDSTQPGGLSANDNSLLQAASICSAGGFGGSTANYSPQPKTDCAATLDPLAARLAPSVGGCDPSKTNLTITTSTTLYPGTYCGGLKISNAAVVTLMAGTYVMKDGSLDVTNNSTLTGSYVGFYFTGTSANSRMMKLDVKSNINLIAPKDGDMAGLLFFQDRNANAGLVFEISSENASNLLGTIYLPRGTLYFGGTQPVAQNSAFTVIVAQSIQLQSGPTMYLNTNYYGTDVPVPDGLGPNSGAIALVN